MPFDQAVADEICERITSGESLRTICKDEHIPSAPTVFKWLSSNAEFAERYARAREAQMDAMVEEILEIADDGTNDFKTDDEGRPVLDKEHIQRSRVRIDTRKWIMSKLAPKKFSDKLDLNVGGELNLKQRSDEEINQRLAQLMGAAGVAAGAKGEDPDGEGEG